MVSLKIPLVLIKEYASQICCLAFEIANSHVILEKKDGNSVLSHVRLFPFNFSGLSDCVC